MEEGLSVAKTLSRKGEKAAEAYAAKFLTKYEAVLKKLAITVLQKGIGRKPGSANGVKITGLVNTPFLDAKRGCQTASVDLHPHKDVYSEMGGSDAKPNIPDALDAIKKLNIFPNEKFISGHVLNAEFGGVGANSANQTVLTTAANSQHHFDENVKSAWVNMTKAWEEMCKFVVDDDGKTYTNDLLKNWAIHIEAVVSDESWYDTYKIDPTLKADPKVLKVYPLDCVAAQVEFTAKELNGPTVEAIAEKLQIDPKKMRELKMYMSHFHEFLSQAAKFVVKQEAPKTFGDRSPVSAEATDDEGTVTPIESKAWKNKIKVTVKAGTGAPVAPKVAVKTYDSYFTSEDGSEIDLADGDNEVGSTTPGYPWATGSTDLDDEIVFCVLTYKTGGPAYVSLEPGVKTKIEVDGARLTTKSALELKPDQKIRVYDKKELTNGYYELTYTQK
jgi:hypothetical protein